MKMINKFYFLFANENEFKHATSLIFSCEVLVQVTDF
jgi:hypothetical protein